MCYSPFIINECCAKGNKDKRMFFNAFGTYEGINFLYKVLYMLCVILKRDLKQDAVIRSSQTVMAGQQDFSHHALPSRRSRVESLANERSPLSSLLTDAFQRGLHTRFSDVRGLTLGSSSKQFHFPTSSTSPLCSMEYLRSNDAVSF